MKHLLLIIPLLVPSVAQASEVTYVYTNNDVVKTINNFEGNVSYAHPEKETKEVEKPDRSGYYYADCVDRVKRRFPLAEQRAVRMRSIDECQELSEEEIYLGI